MKMPYIPEDAPFSGDQRAWLAGFLAGLRTHSTLLAQTVTPSDAAACPVHILFGSQTGNAESVANEAADVATSLGFAPNVRELDSVELEEFSTMQHVILVVSTYGEGEMPDNAELFWGALSATTAPRLEAMNYAVLALGDTSYDEFCQSGKLLDTRLEQLGATRLSSRLDCDVEYEDPASEWLTSTVPLMGDVKASSSEPPKSKKAATWSRKKPFHAQVLENRLLSGPRSAKEIRHFGFALPEAELRYEAGDALGVFPRNDQPYVDQLLARLGVNGDTDVGQDAPLGELLVARYEIRTPSKELIATVERLAAHPQFSHVVGHGDKQALADFLWGLDVLDLLNLNPAFSIDPVEFVSHLKPLQHRAYSISSSPKACADEVHLTVAAVRWQHAHREHKGVASTYLSDAVDAGGSVPVFVSPNKSFRIPTDNSAPMIMVGPGTGIAPFRAFLQERRACGATGKNWLFFGDQHRESDFIYGDEMGQLSRDGLLRRLDLAFSRDQTEKIYVQDRMRENAKALYAWLQDGGYFYVCGDATRMARDVERALMEIIAQEGAMSQPMAQEYVNTLKREKRYLRDVY